MKVHLKPILSSSKDQLQSGLLLLAGIFTFFFALALTFAPAVRLHSWDVEYRWKHWLGFSIWVIGWFSVDRISRKYLPDRDPYLLPVTGLMTGWGLLTIWRLDEYFGLRQTIWLLVGLFILLIGLRSHHLLGFLRRFKYIWLTTGLLLMALTFIIGLYPSGEGPRLWLGCCGVYLQPSEPLKILLIIYLAALLSERVPLHFSFLSLIIPSLVLTGAALVILLAQRDLGTASIFLGLYAWMVFLASGRKRIALLTMVILIVAGLIGYRLFDVIQIRVDAWLNPWQDPVGGSYQIIQSLQAIAAGGVIGTGPGLGSPGLVPVSHSDFIYAAISEETGLLGSFGILILIGLFANRAFVIAIRAPNLYQRFLASGLSLLIFLQSILIIGGNVRLLPLTGITLPFISYGGSSLLTSFFCLLLLLIISNQNILSQSDISQNKAYKLSSIVIFLLLFLAGSFNFWWAMIRGDDLLSREDNLRPVITDRFVKRGAILDRNNQPINQTSGYPGSYIREYLAPSIGNFVGYTHPQYGNSGLELVLDQYLRGLAGSSTPSIWFDRVFYSQTPVGNDVRLTLDLDIQTRADDLLGDLPGAILLMNAESGEILASASHPGIDPTKLDALTETWKSDPQSPFLNRVLQGSYPVGTTFGPFLLAHVSQITALPGLPSTLSLFNDGNFIDCTIVPSSPTTWGSVISSGCPSPILNLADQISIDQISLLYHQLGFYSIPSLPLEQAVPDQPSQVQNQSELIFGNQAPRLSPLQMGMAVSALTHAGVLPSPRYVLSVHSSDNTWQILPSNPHNQVLDQVGLMEVTRMLQLQNIPAWHTVASAVENESMVTWFIGGTLPDWRGAPLALVIVLEGDYSNQALFIGTELFKYIFR